ncbi:MAG: SidA/IucD/PvdA family monooxygenase [Chitinophagaceae bacterium]|nr:SidA/IucD/PvdA family monooxygenase [Chitinophagaceae bacterium]
MNNTVFDLLAIGIGPFNLGLAALTHPLKKMKTVFLEKKTSFNWHPGMLIEGTTLQVPYLADLVTLVDPASPFSYLNFLRKENRLLQFGIRQAQYITRTEYNRYCQWVCRQLDVLRFDHSVQAIHYEPTKEYYIVHCKDQSAGLHRFHAKKIVIGTGSVPSLPACMEPDQLSSHLFHSSDYLFHQKEIENSSVISIIGSGQSAAEIYYDLLCNQPGKQVCWFTRSDRLYAMETNKLIYEMNTPDYIDYFYELEQEKKKELQHMQHTLYKGVNEDLLNSIYDHLYEQRTEYGKLSSMIKTDVSLEHVERLNNESYRLRFHHNRTERSFLHETNCVILATGYQYNLPGFIDPIRENISWLANGQYKVNRDYSIDKTHSVFVQNAETHSHGFNAADLSLGPYRNAVIINSILGNNHYPTDHRTTFQQFGMTD